MSNAAWISRQKSSSWATSVALRPSACRIAGRMRESASLLSAGSVAPATVLDEDAPQRARDGNDRDPSPAPREKAAEHHEQNEQRVERDNGVREQPVDHA